MPKWLDRLFLGLLSAALGAVCLGTILLWPKEETPTSWYENRALEKMPEWSKAGAWSGEDFTQLDAALADRVAGRDALIALDTRTDLALGRPVVHKVARGDGALLNFHGYYHWELGYLQTQAQDMGDRLSAVRDATEEVGGRFFYLGTPHQASYFRDRYPDYMDDRAWVMDETKAQFETALAARDIAFLDAGAYYDSLGRPAEYYSPSDHHWTYAGMLAAYRWWLGELNAATGWELPILEEEQLELTALPNPFLGSFNRQLYGCWPDEETLTLGRVVEEIPYRRWDNGVETAAGFYATPATDTEYVAYGAYMGGDVGETILQTDRPHLPKVLLWGDSFTNALETVLWTSFDETRSLDLRYYTGKSLTEYIRDYQPDLVLCLRDDTMYLDAAGNGGVE